MENEIWKDVVDFEGYYQVSNLGRFRSLDRVVIRKDGANHTVKGGVLKGTTKSGHDGYVTVALNKGEVRITRKLHRLIAIAFMPIDNYKNMDVNHIDFDRTNNTLSNLEWVTHQENIKHSSDAGRYKDNTKGCRNGRAGYTKEEIKYIRSLYDSGKTVMEVVSELFPGLDYKQRKNKWSRINEICKRVTYNNVV